VSAALSIPTATARADRARRAWRIVLAATLMGALVVGSAILCRVDVVGFLPGLFQGLSVLRHL
jgi:hypothetical protein